MRPYEHVISFSGGKDSTALYLLALERGRPFTPVFADTMNEHEAVYEVVEALPILTGGPQIQTVRADFSGRITHKRHVVQTKWVKEGVADEIIRAALDMLHPTGNAFLDLCIWKGRFPSSRVRFCTEELKVEPIRRVIYAPAIAAGRSVISWQGVRADESYARSLLPRWQRLESKGRVYAYRPLLAWTVEDVWAMHAKHGVPPNALYRQGMTRVGCMPCIMCKKDELREIAKRFPEHIQRIEKWEAVVAQASKISAATFFTTTDDPATEPGIRSRVEWSKTSRGGRQYDLVLAADFATSCDQWGACE